MATILEPEVYSDFVQLAERNERSVAAELRIAIKRHLNGGDEQA